MSFWTGLENFATTVVKDVEAIGAKIEQGIEDVEKALTAGEQLVVSSAPQITDSLEGILEALGAADTAVVPEVVAVVTAVEALLAKFADLLPAA
jgi:hypothetical protein